MLFCGGLFLAVSNVMYFTILMAGSSLLLDKKPGNGEKISAAVKAEHPRH
jgi:hypothetical protein